MPRYRAKRCKPRNAPAAPNQMRSEQFRQYRNAPNHCKRCSKKQETNIMFCWTACNHWYCVECTFQIINESLSMMNEIPKCIYPKCNQSLNVLHAQTISMEKRTALLPKYRVSGGNMHCALVYNQTDCLVAGYIRFGSNSHNFPVDVALMIFDYFKLVYYTKIRCQHCRSRGYIYVDCTRCEARGYTTNCDVCGSSGTVTISIKCSKCKGSGNFIKDYPCQRCDGRGKFPRKECKRCNGCGRYHCRKCGGTGRFRGGECWSCKGQRYIGDCHRCNGSGQRRTACKRFNGTGTYRHKIDCKKCDGKKSIILKRKCKNCNGTGSRRSRCTECKGNKQVQSRCQTCGGNKATMALDFNTLCNKQSLCIKCGLFHPNDMIIYWSGCNHVYCIDCIRGEITEQNHNQKRVPICISNECSQSLSLERMNCIPGITTHGYCVGGKHYVPTRQLRPWSGCDHLNCDGCAGSHIQNDITAKRIPLCMVDQCSSPLLLKQLNRISSIVSIIPGIYSYAFCVGCCLYVDQQSTCPWPGCDHIVCTECAKHHIQRNIGQERIPLCMVRHCESELTVNVMQSLLMKQCGPFVISPLTTGTLQTLIYRKDQFQCTKCTKWLHNSLKVEWSSKCRHKYCTRCIRKIMDDSFPRKKPVIGIFKALKIPCCVAIRGGTQCGEQFNLWISKIKAVGASEFQIKTMSKLIEGARNGKKEEKCLVM